ncbi:MAG: SCO family protein [Proteobacteria bacterium]|nr:MAG: SCO family protein [Pseudomonadota bacterium]QKK11224.1 MAG: SCO family protein [Pseudomonadota bacterium]
MNDTTNNRRQRLKSIAIIALVIATTVVAYWINRPASEAPSPTRIPAALQSVLWPEPKPLPDFTLTDHLNRPFTKEAFQGRWTFLFFGYISCPDVCPSTLAVLQAVAEQVAAPTGLTAKPQYVFLSVDPQRDTPERLGEYLGYFNPQFVGVTGTEEAIAALTPKLFVLYEKAESRSATDYDINHTASILLIDPQARLFGRFSPPHTPADMVTLFSQLREHYQRTAR